MAEGFTGLLDRCRSAAEAPRASPIRPDAAKTVDARLVARFRRTIESAFRRRLEELGVAEGVATPAKCRRVAGRLDERRRRRGAEFLARRRRFEDELRRRTAAAADHHRRRHSPARRSKKAPAAGSVAGRRSTTTKTTPADLENNGSVDPSKRAPVPAPRRRDPPPPAADLMARDGEADGATFRPPKSAKDLAESLERQVGPP